MKKTPKKRKAPARAKSRKRSRKNPAMLLIRGNPRKRRASKPSSSRRRKGQRHGYLKRAAPRRRSSSRGVHPLVSALARKPRITVEQMLEVGRKVPEFGRVLARHKRFHGTWPDRIEVLESDDATVPYAMGLGDSRAIEYSVPTSSGRRGLPFRHRFDPKRQVVATDASGRRVLLLRRKGSRMRVTERGIIG